MNEEVKNQEKKEGMETWEGYQEREDICTMIFEADVKKLNESFKKAYKRNLIFGTRVTEAEALTEVSKKEILCRVKTKTQESYVILTYERVWEFYPDNDIIIFRTLLA